MTNPQPTAGPLLPNVPIPKVLAGQTAIDGEVLAVEKFINVGGRALVPDMPGLDQVEYLTNTSMLELDVLQPPFDDRVQLQQVLLNLIRNGIEAISTVTDRPRLLKVSVQRHEADQLLAADEDAGTGLDPAIVERVFDPLFTTKSDGMGMGLSICRSIVEAHGGRLWASRNSPHGTIFRFTLPSRAIRASRDFPHAHKALMRRRLHDMTHLQQSVPAKLM
jgi:signal transduction histidine kinase